MSLQKPLVSIAIPVYNEALYLAETLDSLLAQDYTNYESLIRDNASSDETEAISRSYTSKDSRIRYERSSQNDGAAVSFNELVKMSAGDYFVLGSGHDWWQPQFLSKCLNVLERNPSVVLCYSRTVYLDVQGRELGIHPCLIDIRTFDGCYFAPLQQFNLVLWDCFNSYVIHGMIRSSSLKKTRLERLTFGADTILLSELSLLGLFAQIPESLFYARRFRDYEVCEVLERQERYVRPDKINKGISFSYFRFAREYLGICFDRGLPLSFRIRLLVCMSLILRFLATFFKNPTRPFRTSGF